MKRASSPSKQSVSEVSRQTPLTSKSRPGSTASMVRTPASVPTLSLTSKPTSLDTSQKRTAAFTSGLPRPGTGPSARSAIQLPARKVFGDARGVTNRPLVKGSMDPTSIQRTSSMLLKARSGSTPASTIARSNSLKPTNMTQSKHPPLLQSRITTKTPKSSAGPSATIKTASAAPRGVTLSGIADLRARMEKLQAKQPRR